MCKMVGNEIVCFDLTPPKGPCGIKLCTWWKICLTSYILLSILGIVATAICLFVAICCLATGFLMQGLIASTLTVCTTIWTIYCEKRVARYWWWIRGPRFKGVKLPVIKAKLLDLRMDEIAKMQPLDKRIGKVFHQDLEDQANTEDVQ